MASDGPAGESMERNSVTSYDEWSYSDLDPSSDFVREEGPTECVNEPFHLRC